MQYRPFPGTALQISILGLGGHEYLPDGRSRGFNEDSARAVTPGEIFPGFGGEKRKRVLKTARDAGINFFDVTIDSEKEALGRDFAELPGFEDVLVQTRPEGMGYRYDPGNPKLADARLLRNEVERILGLLRRDRIEFLNFPFTAEALEADPRYMERIERNIRELKAAGLIRFAVADTLSGEPVYLRQVEAGCFDAVVLNFNVADDGAAERLFPAAAAAGMGVFCREAFIKGRLFREAGALGVEDCDALARAAVKWTLRHPQVTSVLVGVDNPSQLANLLRVVKVPGLSSDEQEALDRITGSPAIQALRQQKRAAFR